jgi:hypothetical protein
VTASQLASDIQQALLFLELLVSKIAAMLRALLEEPL